MDNKLLDLKVYCKGDSDYNGSVILEAVTLTEAKEALRDYVHCHSTKAYPFRKVSTMGYESKFMAVYIDAYHFQDGYNGSFPAIPNSDETEFCFMTDEIIIRVVGYDVNITVDTIDDGLRVVKSFMREGQMPRIKVEKLFYVKRFYAFDKYGNLLLHYFPVWREVPVH